MIWSRIEIDYLIENYNIIPPIKIAQQLNRSYAAIIQKANSIGLKTEYNYHTPKYNESFLDIWTPELAYFTGVVLADGCVSPPDGSLGYYVRISMCDLDIIEKLKKNADSQGNIRKDKNGNNIKDRFTIDFRGKKICDFFIDLGIGYNKTHTVKFPNMIPIRYMSHFIRGIFDGDGSICININKHGYPRAKICGTKNVIESISHYARIPNNIYKKHQDGTTYDIQYSGDKAIEFLNYIYKDSNINIRMNRKYNKYLESFKWQQWRKQ